MAWVLRWSTHCPSGARSKFWQKGKVHLQRYARGVAETGLEVIGDTDQTGTVIEFKPDAEIFETVKFSFEFIAVRLRELAFLTRGVEINVRDERSGDADRYFYEGGVQEFVRFLNEGRSVLHRDPIYLQGERDEVVVEVALQYNDSYQETLFTYANNIKTDEGGTHLVGFRSALTRTINNYANRNNLLKNVKFNISGDDTREGIAAVVSVKVPEPQFEGQTKGKLGNSEVKGIVDSFVSEALSTYLEENPGHRQADRR